MSPRKVSAPGPEQATVKAMPAGVRGSPVSCVGLDADGARVQPYDRSGDGALPPLRWVAEEDLVFDPAMRTPHRPGCRLASELHAGGQAIAAGAPELVWAPRLCHCGPDLTLALG